MSKSRDNKHRRARASYKLANWRAQRSTSSDVAVEVEIVAVKGTLPVPAKKK